MFKLVLFIGALSFSFFSFTQSHTPGTFNFSLGYEGGGNGVLYDSKYDNGTISYENPQDSSFAFTNLFRFDGHYNILNFLSIGAKFKMGKYVEDPENTQAAGNNISSYALSARIYLVNKDRFALYGGASFGGNHLVMNRLVKIIVAIPYTYKFRGTHFGIEAGFNWFISKNVGVNIGLGYTSQKYLMKEYTLNLEEQDLSNFENVLRTKGLVGNIGLTFKLGN